MAAFIIKRLWQMIPTLLGVMLITFVLFNVVGGSPARMKLGDRASAQSLEDFDEQRGFNKPLFWGRQVATRAWPETDLDREAGPWARVAGAVHVPGTTGERGYVRLPVSDSWRVPLVFPLHAERRYDVRCTWRVRGQTSWTHTALELSPSADISRVLRELPGGPAVMEVAQLRVRRVMERPWDSQLWFYVRNLVRLDFGFSSSANEPVLDIIKRGIGPTLALTLPILVLETLIGVSLALWCAFYRGQWLDRVLVVGSVALMSVNYLVWIVGGQYVLAYRLGWFPVWGFASWSYLMLPVLIGTLSGLGSSVRFYRTVMLDEMYKDYVRTAFAKGVCRSGVLFRHVLPNAMIPVLTHVVLSIPFLYTGSLLLESFFGIPGLGYLGVNAINDSDVDVVRAIVIIGSVLYLAANLLADLCYAWVDPRVRVE
jgi:peptide/nickel transport system permease protein